MKNRTIETVWTCVIILVCAFGNFFYGVYIGKNKIRKQAVKQGYAEYVMNPDTLEVEFQWKTNKQDTD